MKKYFCMLSMFIVSITVSSCDDTTVNSVNDLLVMSFQQGVYPTSGYDREHDTYINSSSAASNYGIQFYLSVGANGGAIFRSLIKFDVSDIVPDDVDVVKAYLTLTGAGSVGTIPSLTVYKVNSLWSETQATWDSSVTGTAWVTAGGEISASPVSETITNPEGTVTFSLDTNMVKEWIMDDSNNFGIAIVSLNESTGTGYIDFISGDEPGYISMRPKLTIYYRLP